MNKINLQLFAEEDDVELEETTDEVEETDEEKPEVESDEDGEETPVEEDEESAKPKVDKVTAKLINVKKQNKLLKDELQSLKKRVEEREQADNELALRQKLIDGGFSDEEIEDRITERKERETLKKELKELKYNRLAESLAPTYPDIFDHLDEFVDIVETSKGKWTLAEVCKAKLSRASAKEIRTKAEQEMLLKKQKAESKKVATGETKAAETVKLAPKDEQLLARMNQKRQMAGKPILTKQQFIKYSNGDV